MGAVGKKHPCPCPFLVHLGLNRSASLHFVDGVSVAAKSVFEANRHVPKAAADCSDWAKHDSPIVPVLANSKHRTEVPAASVAGEQNWGRNTPAKAFGRWGTAVRCASSSAYTCGSAKAQYSRLSSRLARP